MPLPRRQKNAARRPDVEKWLSDHGVEWEYWPNFPLEEVDIDKSLHNQARMFEPLDETVVSQYAEAYQRGDQFPAVVLSRTNQRQRAVAIDGNHRINAMDRAGGADVDAYVVTKARPATIVQLTFEANVRHGKPTSHEERLNQAVWLVDNGATKELAAGAVNLKVADLNKAWSRISADRRADEVGISRRDWESLTAGTRVRISRIVTDEGFKAAANLCFRAALNFSEVDELVVEMNKVRSSTKQIAVVKNFETMYSERIQSAGGVVSTGKRSRTPKQVLGMVLGNIQALPDNLDVVAERYIGDERDDTAKRAREASKVLANLADRLEAATVSR